MSPLNPKSSIALYREAKDAFVSLIQQMAAVFVGLTLVLVLSGGKPSSLVMIFSFVLGVTAVAKSEQVRVMSLGSKTEDKEESEEGELPHQSAPIDITRTWQQILDGEREHNRALVLRLQEFEVLSASLRLELEQLRSKVSEQNLRQAYLEATLVKKNKGEIVIVEPSHSQTVTDYEWTTGSPFPIGMMISDDGFMEGMTYRVVVSSPQAYRRISGTRRSHKTRRNYWTPKTYEVSPRMLLSVFENIRKSGGRIISIKPVK